MCVSANSLTLKFFLFALKPCECVLYCIQRILFFALSAMRLRSNSATYDLINSLTLKTFFSKCYLLCWLWLQRFFRLFFLHSSDECSMWCSLCDCINHHHKQFTFACTHILTLTLTHTHNKSQMALSKINFFLLQALFSTLWLYMLCSSSL